MTSVRWMSAICLIATLGLFSQVSSSQEKPANGQLRNADSAPEAWNAGSGQWLPVEAWWMEYAQGSDGKFWGKRSDYPPYEQVGEHDTLLIVVEEGPCLMYFFHQRWRRAQDVRRWDPAYNEILGCPHVFD